MRHISKSGDRFASRSSGIMGRQSLRDMGACGPVLIESGGFSDLDTVVSVGTEWHNITDSARDFEYHVATIQDTLQSRMVFGPFQTPIVQPGDFHFESVEIVIPANEYKPGDVAVTITDPNNHTVTISSCGTFSITGPLNGGNGDGTNGDGTNGGSTGGDNTALLVVGGLALAWFVLKD